MTVATQIDRSGPYAGAGTTGPFTVSFRFLDATHLQVIRTDGTGEHVLTLTTDYTVAGVGNPTGSVTLVTALPVGQTLTIIRKVPKTQEADYVQNSDFPAESHEDALDKLTMISQETGEVVTRAITLPTSDSSLLIKELPIAALRANKAVVFRPDGSVGVSADDYNDQAANAAASAAAAAASAVSASSSANSAAAIYDSFDDRWLGPKASDPTLDNDGNALLEGAAYWSTPGKTIKVWSAVSNLWYTITAFLQAGVGAISRTWQDKARDTINVMDFGAIGDANSHPLSTRYASLAAAQVDYPHATALTDEIDWAAWQAAVNHAQGLARGGHIEAAVGHYKFNRQLNVIKVANKRITINAYGATISATASYTGILMYMGETPAATTAPPAEVSGLTFAGNYLPVGVFGAFLKLENANGYKLNGCVFESGAHQVELQSSYAVRFTECSLANYRDQAIKIVTTSMQLVLDKCQILSGGPASTGGVRFVDRALQVTFRNTDFEGGGSPSAVEFLNGGASVVFDTSYVEGYSASPLAFSGGTVTGLEFKGGWLGYNAGTQVWQNITNSIVDDTYIENQASSQLSTAVDLIFGSGNSWTGSSNRLYSQFKAPTLGAGFTNTGAPWEVAGYMKTRDGVVILRGMVQAAVDGSPFTLPATYRPAAVKTFAAFGASGTIGHINVFPTGVVNVIRSSDTTLDLGAVSFVAQQ